MRDHQWRLTYPAAGPNPGADMVFGTLDTGAVTLVPPEVAPADVRAGDIEPSGADGVRFGVDRRGGLTVTFELGVDTVDTGQGWADNDDAVEAFARVWRADAVRLIPGAVAALTCRRGGRERMVYGRPRRFATADERFAEQGYTAVTCDFLAASDVWLDAATQVERVPLVPPSAGGLEAPLASPLSTVAESSTTGTFAVGGTQPTWPLIEIHGPIVDPTVEVVGLWRLGMQVNLAYDQWVTIDPRPWTEATVTRNDGASLAGAFTRFSPLLTDLIVPPGRWEMTLRGRDLTGTSYVEVAWQDAYASR